MSYSKGELQKLVKNLNIHPSTFNEDDYKIIEKGGISISDSEDHIDSDSLRDTLTKSMSSVDLAEAKINLDNVLIHKLGQEKNKRALDETRTRYGAIIMNLEKKILELENEKNKIRLQKDHEIQKLMQDHKRQIDHLTQESKRTSTLRNIHSSRDFLNILSDVINDAIPEVEYFRIRDIPERDLREDESNLVHIWELVNPIKDDSKKLRSEISNLRDEIRQLNDKNQNLVLELRHANDILSRKDDDIKRNINNYETSIKMLQSELNKSLIDLESLREKGTKYDDLYRDFVRLEKEKIILENKLSFFSGVADVKHDMPQNESDLKAKYSILCTDKEYLTKENLRLVEANKKLEEKIDRLENEIEETKKLSKDYLTQLFNSKNNMFYDYEKKINMELAELRGKHKDELESAKNNLRDIYERQISFLKDNKEELEIKLEQLNTQVKEKQKAYDEVLEENRNLQRRVNHDVSELRIQLRLKTDELERVQNLYEEAQANIKSLRIENDMVREKNNVLKGEYYKLEANIKEETAGLRAQLAVAKEQLSNYENIENEIDEAILGMGKSAEFEGSNVFLQTLQSAPTSSKRRIQQALSLAQRLNTKQRECEEIQKKLSQTEKERESLQQELSIAKSLINKSQQPYGYLVQTIEEKEHEIKDLKEKLRSNNDEYQNLKLEHSQLLQDYATLQKDLNKLVIRRENIKRIQQILLGLLGENRENINQNDIYNLIEEMNQITSEQKGGLEKKVTIGTKSEFRNTQGQTGLATPPTKENFRMHNTIGATGTAPNWFNKLKDNLRK